MAIDIREFSALLHAKWEPCSTSKSAIRGTWAEDGSEYVLSVPPQLRDMVNNSPDEQVSL